MYPNYNDELVIFEHGQHAIDEYKEWYSNWLNWLNT